VTGVLRFGVLGCAEIAWRRVLPALQRAPCAHLVAVGSRDAGRARTFADRFSCEPVSGYAAVLERDDVDAVYVPLPLALHAEWTERALLAGKHVLAEKPLAPRHAETEALVALARSRRLILAENFMFAFHAQHDAVRKLVAAGAIGELRAFHSAFTIPPRAADDIRYRPELGGGALHDVGCYPLRAAQLFLGPGLRLAGAVLSRDAELGVDIAGAALVQAPSGVTGQLTFGMQHAYRSSYELWGTAGRLVLERAFAPPPDYEPTVHIERVDGAERIRLPADDQYVNAVTAFANAVLTGERPVEWEEATLAHAALLDELANGAASFNAHSKLP
jgi:NDP-hexose-3-ketoreductase